MREMRDSGIELIGEIPKGWQTKALKYCADVIMGQSPDSRLITDYGTTPFLQGNREFGAVHPEPSLFCDFCPQYSRIGDILMSVRAPVGAINESDRLYGIGRGLCSIKAVNSHKKFLKYVLLNYKDDWRWFSNGSTFDAITTETLQSLLIPVPPIKEQQAIASYLDCKCAEIDTLTMDIEAQIKTLEQYKQSMITEAVTKGLNPDVEMKDSGIEWIGQMPSHWKLIRGKFVLTCLQRPVLVDDDVITCFRDGEVTLRSNRREEGFTMSDKEIGYQGVDIGDLVVHGMDGFAGAIGISDSRGKASPVLNVLDSNQNKRYIMYYLRSIAYSDVFIALATGIRVRSCDLRWNKLSELFYPIPPLDEQSAIVEYIDNKIKKTNILITDKQAQLGTLAEYNKSLIYEYVTGKKEVPSA